MTSASYEILPTQKAPHGKSAVIAFTNTFQGIMDAKADGLNGAILRNDYTRRAGRMLEFAIQAKDPRRAIRAAALSLGRRIPGVECQMQRAILDDYFIEAITPHIHGTMPEEIICTFGGVYGTIVFPTFAAKRFFDTGGFLNSLEVFVAEDGKTEKPLKDIDTTAEESAQWGGFSVLPYDLLAMFMPKGEQPLVHCGSQDTLAAARAAANPGARIVRTPRPIAVFSAYQK